MTEHRGKLFLLIGLALGAFYVARAQGKLVVSAQWTRTMPDVRAGAQWNRPNPSKRK